MLKLTKLKTYAKKVRMNQRRNETEVDALDPERDNELKEIRIPDNGYILKSGEIYIAEVNNPGSEHYLEENFLEDLTKLGVTCRIVGDETLLTVQRPVRIYKDQRMFYETNE